MKFSSDEKRALWILLILFAAITFIAFRTHNGIWLNAFAAFGVLILITVLVGGLRRLRLRLNEIDRDNQAVTALYSVLKPERPLPELGGYALSAGKAAKLMDLVLEHKPRLIVELGSGVSTLVSAYCLKKIGAGRIVSYDHDEKFADITRDNIARHGLSAYVEVIHAPLAEVAIQGNHYKWYQIDAEQLDGNIDLLFVDGPPRKTQSLARYPALRFFASRLNPGALLLLDDANRADEITIKQKWLAENPELTRDSSYFRDDMFIAHKNAT